VLPRLDAFSCHGDAKTSAQGENKGARLSHKSPCAGRGGVSADRGVRWSPNFGQRVKLIPAGLRTGDGQGYTQAAHG
jgi:hypothetical protein